MKGNCLSDISLRIWCLTELRRAAHELAQIPVVSASSERFEQENRSSVCHMVTDGSISFYELHIAMLTFSEVNEYPVIGPAIVITVLSTR